MSAQGNWICRIESADCARSAALFAPAHTGHRAIISQSGKHIGGCILVGYRAVSNDSELEAAKA
jgi:hypothetical protein